MRGRNRENKNKTSTISFYQGKLLFRERQKSTGGLVVVERGEDLKRLAL